MISKAEFLERIKTEVFTDSKEKKLKLHKKIICCLIALFISFFAWYTIKTSKNGFSESEIIELAVLFLIGWALIAVVHYFHVHRNIYLTKGKLYQILDMPQLDVYEGSADRWFAKMQMAKLFANDLRAHYFPSFTKDTTLVFDDLNANVFEGYITTHYGKYNHIGNVFRGLLVEVRTKHFYEEPIVFIKRGFFTGRDKLKKVKLREKDARFDISTNNESAAQNLYSQGITSKLMSIDQRFFKIRNVEASFFEDKLYIALYTNKDLFEPLTKHYKDIHQYELFYDEIEKIKTYCAQFTDL